MLFNKLHRYNTLCCFSVNERFQVAGVYLPYKLNRFNSFKFLQMSQVPIRTEDAVYKSQWPIQNNAGDRYTEEFSKKWVIKGLFFQKIIFGYRMADVSSFRDSEFKDFGLDFLLSIFKHFWRKKVGMDLTKEEASGGLTTSKSISSRIRHSIWN